MKGKNNPRADSEDGEPRHGTLPVRDERFQRSRRPGIAIRVPIRSARNIPDQEGFAQTANQSRLTTPCPWFETSAMEIRKHGGGPFFRQRSISERHAHGLARERCREKELKAGAEGNASFGYRDCGTRNGSASPSTQISDVPAFKSTNDCLLPEGHRISRHSTRRVFPNPKNSFRSLLAW